MKMNVCELGSNQGTRNQLIKNKANKIKLNDLFVKMK